MKNQKVIAISAMVGFCLSCFAGFLGGAGLLIIFIRAFVFGLIFGILGWGAGFVLEKFLDLSTADSFSASLSEKSTASPEKTANVVDITIADENLPTEEREPDFSVTKVVKTYHGVLDNSKTIKEPPLERKAELKPAPVETEIVKESISVPSLEKAEPEPKSEKPDTVAKTAPAAPKKEVAFEGFVPDLTPSSEPETNEKPVASSASSDGELDELPDLSEIVEDDIQTGGAMVNDTEFASATSVSSSTSDSGTKSKGNVADIKDTELLAKAIRTAIANDS